MSLGIRVDGERADEELLGLHRWLLGVPDVRYNAEIELVYREHGPGNMGNTLDLITLGVTGTLALPAFADAVAGWFGRLRRPRPRVTIEYRDLKVLIDEADGDIAERIIRAIGPL